MEIPEHEFERWIKCEFQRNLKQHIDIKIAYEYTCSYQKCEMHRAQLEYNYYTFRTS